MGVFCYLTPRYGMLRCGAQDPILSLPCCLLEGSDTRAAHLSDSAERKQCYYHISDVRLCDSVLAKNITKEECCCTVGAAWGDNCETYPCPIPGTGRTVAPPHQAGPVLWSACQLHLDCTNEFLLSFFSFHLLLASVSWSVEYQEICPLGKGYIPQEDLLSGKVSFTGTSTIFFHFFQGEEGEHDIKPCMKIH